MARNRQSAKKAGTSFERTIADYLATHVDDRIDRRTKTGALDKGDIANVRTRHGERLVLECKNVSHLALPEWTREAETERRNDGALAGIVIHKRHGKSAPGEQWVSMTLDNFVALLTGNRDHIN
ncbi:MAG: hypothetical protein PUK59_04650 [Actinomycetaceae bacterium]|nr:hypothetical protein [Actinomycetaceae bacterium]MDY5273636.1 hypothetical protein [Arcanobacterium sp.]